MGTTGTTGWIVLWNEHVENFRILLDYMYGGPILQETFVPLFQMALKYEVRYLNYCILETIYIYLLNKLSVIHRCAYQLATS